MNALEHLDGWTMRGMTEVERNRIRAKLRRLEMSDAVIERYLHKCKTELETFASASRTVNQWEKPNPESFILQALVCGISAALLGGWLAYMGGI